MMKCESSSLNNAVTGGLGNVKATAAVNKEADAPLLTAAHDGMEGSFYRNIFMLRLTTRRKINSD
jgi:hypothetical protein